MPKFNCPKCDTENEVTPKYHPEQMKIYHEMQLNPPQRQKGLSNWFKWFPGFNRQTAFIQWAFALHNNNWNYEITCPVCGYKKHFIGIDNEVK